MAGDTLSTIPDVRDVPLADVPPLGGDALARVLPGVDTVVPVAAFNSSI